MFNFNRGDIYKIIYDQFYSDVLWASLKGFLNIDPFYARG